MKILKVHGDKEERGQRVIMWTRFEHGVVFAEGMALSDDF
jgi:hypothetical protein